MKKLSIHIDTSKLVKGSEGRIISQTLRELADSLQGGVHFNMVGSWGACALYHPVTQEPIGSMEIIETQFNHRVDFPK